MIHVIADVHGSEPWYSVSRPLAPSLRVHDPVPTQRLLATACRRLSFELCGSAASISVRRCHANASRRRDVIRDATALSDLGHVTSLPDADTG